MAAPNQPGPALSQGTLRQVVRTSVGGSKVRLHLSNRFGARPLKVGAVHVALQARGFAIAPGSDHPITLHGRASITIPVGQSRFSDAVGMEVAPRAALAVSLYLPAGSGPSTLHGVANQTAYIRKGGDHTSATMLPSEETDDARYFLTDVEVATRAEPRLIVALSDSTTDGVGSSLEGINDITAAGTLPTPRDQVSAQNIIRGLQTLISRAHAKGLEVFGDTLLPRGGSEGRRRELPEGAAKRQTVNAWIRSA